VCAGQLSESIPSKRIGWSAVRACCSVAVALDRILHGQRQLSRLSPAASCFRDFAGSPTLSPRPGSCSLLGETIWHAATSDSSAWRLWNTPRSRRRAATTSQRWRMRQRSPPKSNCGCITGVCASSLLPLSLPSRRFETSSGRLIFHSKGQSAIEQGTGLPRTPRLIVCPRIVMSCTEDRETFPAGLPVFRRLTTHQMEPRAGCLPSQESSNGGRDEC
jgi:hypothetical protein